MKQVALMTNIVLLLTACALPGSGPVPPTATSQPSSTAPQTATARAQPTPTATKRPTAASEPTDTPTRTPTKTPTPVPSDVPPVIEIQEVPDGLHARIQITIPLKIFDWDGDDIQVDVQQQLGMGDRYNGDEYVTAQELEQLSLEEDELLVRARFPGNYRVLIRATDKHGTTEQELDLPVAWPPGENPFASILRAIIVDTWGPREWHDFSLFPTLIQRAKAFGFNAVEIDPYIANRGNDFFPCQEVDEYCTTPSDATLIRWIDYARDQGLDVILKPHLMSDQGSRESYDIRPIDVEDWFRGYSSQVVAKYAQIAEDHGVAVFCIGNELSQLQRPIYSSHWTNQVIPAARTSFSGALVYSDSDLWYEQGKGTYLSDFWGGLDYIGVPFYFLGSRNDTRPSVASMVDFIQPQLENNLELMRDRYPTKGVFVTELGKPNMDGTNYDHWNWSDDRVPDNQEQVDYLEASLQILSGQPIQGMGLMIYKPKPLNEVAVVRGLDWDIRKQPAEKALRYWFSSSN